MRNKGFSLVEILVVILVLAALTGIAIPTYMLVTARAKESAVENEMMNIAKALELHNVDDQVYPDPGNYPGILEEKNYMSAVPANDLWENEYIYDSDGNSYTLESHGMDGADGGDDDIVISSGSMTEDGAYANR
ncbi:MAG TPA: type II secretion system protein GspG [Actinobacteria bacterium]|nr:type II secretion system protein GspG [Actinomycetota bacterium]